MSEIYKRPERCDRECKYWWFDAWDNLVNGALGLAGTPKIKLEPGEIAIDTHIHTLFSHCSITQPDKLITWAAKIGLGAVCVMDHNHIGGSLNAQRCADNLKAKGIIPESFLVIPGSEINSNCGHIGAMFTNQDFPIDLPPVDIVKAIHDSGGLAVAVHPYHSTGICDAVFDAPFDAVEVECGAVFGGDLVKKNCDLATDPRLEHAAKFGASDAHYYRGIGACYTVIKPTEITLDGIRQAITDRKTVAKSSIPCIRMRKMLGGVPKLK